MKQFFYVIVIPFFLNWLLAWWRKIVPSCDISWQQKFIGTFGKYKPKTDGWRTAAGKRITGNTFSTFLLFAYKSSQIVRRFGTNYISLFSYYRYNLRNCTDCQSAWNFFEFLHNISIFKLYRNIIEYRINFKWKNYICFVSNIGTLYKLRYSISVIWITADELWGKLELEVKKQFLIIVRVN